MTINCPHPRPKLNLPGYTPPRFAWQPPAFLPQSSLADLSRALTEQFRGVYAVLQQLGQKRTVVPLIEDIDARAGQVIVGVGAGQTIRLPEGVGGELGQVGIVLTDVSSPVTLVHPDGSTTSLGTEGAYDFVSGIPDSYQTSPGGTVLGGSIPTDRLLGRDSAGTGAVEFIEAGDDLDFDGSGTLDVTSTWATVLARGNNSGASNPHIDTGQFIGFGVEGSLPALGELRSSTNFFANVTGALELRSSTNAFLQGTGGAVFWGCVSGTARVNTNFVERLRIGTGGGWALAGDEGTSGQVIKSNGPGTPPTWQNDTDTTYSAGDGIDLTGTTFSVDVTDIVDGVSIEEVATNNIQRAALTGAIEASAGSNATLFSAGASGAGLTGGGTAVLAVGAGTRITVNANDVQLAAGAAESFLGNFTAGSAVADYRAGSSVAGAGLTYTAGGTLAVGAGTNVTVGADSVSVDNYPLSGLADQAAETFVGNFTAGSAAPTARAGSSVAGAGLTYTAGGTLAVGAGDGINVAADSVAVDVTDLVGAGIESDGSNNLRIAAAAAGNGLTGGGGSALAVGAGTGITVNANDVAVDQSFSPTWTGVHSFTGASHTINVTGGVSIDADGASNFSTSVGNITVSTTAAGSRVSILGQDDVLIQTTDDAVFITAATQMVLTTGTILRITTNGTERLEIEADGAWQVNGSTGTSGQVLTSQGNAASPEWRTPTKIVTITEWADDFCFISGALLSANLFADTPWFFTLSGAAGGSAQFLTGESNHPGIIRLTTHTVINTPASIVKGGGTVTQAWVAGQDLLEFNVIARLNTTTTVGYFIGFSEDPTQMVITGVGNSNIIGFLFDTAGALADTTIHCITREADGVATNTDTAIAPGTSFRRYTIRQTTVGTIEFLIDGNVVATHSTQVPDAEILNCGITVVTRVAAARTLDVDYVDFTSQPLSR